MSLTRVSTFGQYFLDANFFDTKDLLVIIGPETAPSFQRIVFSSPSTLFFHLSHDYFTQSYANTDGSLIKAISVSPQKLAATTEFKTTIKRVCNMLILFFATSNTDNLLTD